MDTDGQSFNKVCMVNIFLSYEVNKLNGIFPLLHRVPSRSAYFCGQEPVYVNCCLHDLYILNMSFVRCPIYPEVWKFWNSGNKQI